jgi:hypothetical protein
MSGPNDEQRPSSPRSRRAIVAAAERQMADDLGTHQGLEGELYRVLMAWSLLLCTAWTGAGRPPGSATLGEHLKSGQSGTGQNRPVERSRTALM